MAAASSPQPVPESEDREYLTVWSENMGQVLTQVAGVSFALESVPAPPPEVPGPEQHDLQVMVVAAGALRGEMSLRVPRIAVLALGQLFLQEPRDEVAELKPDHRDALEELLRQVSGQVATALNPRWGDVHCEWNPGSLQAGRRRPAVGWSPRRQPRFACFSNGR